MTKEQIEKIVEDNCYDLSGNDEQYNFVNGANKAAAAILELSQKQAIEFKTWCDINGYEIISDPTTLEEIKEYMQKGNELFAMFVKERK